MKNKYWFFIVLLFLGCKDKYTPDIQYPTTGYLVIEGYINSGTGPTVITLTRTASLNNIRVIPEPGAQVEVQSENGASFPLHEDSTGIYSISQVPVDVSQRYRLHIKTTDGKEYLSDLSEVKLTPPIDSVSFIADPEIVTVYVNTHDNNTAVGYYQWEYDETWRYTSAYISDYIYDPVNLYVQRSHPDSLYTCWNSGMSNNIYLASSEKLKLNVIAQFPINKISYFTSNRLVSKYSMLVKQYSLSKEWYEWKDKLKKNTESLGSIFDAQPSTTGGNFHCITDPSAIVIGFVGCTSVQEKRIYITRADIPPTLVFTGFEYCEMTSVSLDQAEQYFNNGGFDIIELETTNGLLTGFKGAPESCVDCRTQGGTIVKPDFWQ